jgi:hypothetical protein
MRSGSAGSRSGTFSEFRETANSTIRWRLGLSVALLATVSSRPLLPSCTCTARLP